jgi:AcrR family transcriptional regulator
MCTLITMVGDAHGDRGSGAAAGPTGRTTYRHGNLRAALVEAGLELARDGGPDAVVLRETTRRARVAPNAAYRHFSDRAALVSAVSMRAQQVVAEEMGREIAAARSAAHADPAAAARAELDAVGRAYVHFALREPGLFTTAFGVHSDLAATQRGHGTAPGPYQRLTQALDQCVDAGVITPAARQGAELTAWSAVHGLATLLLDGPLRFLDEAHRETALSELLHMVHRGLERR